MFPFTVCSRQTFCRHQSWITTTDLLCNRWKLFLNSKLNVRCCTRVKIAYLDAADNIQAYNLKKIVLILKNRLKMGTKKEIYTCVKISSRVFFIFWFVDIGVDVLVDCSPNALNNKQRLWILCTLKNLTRKSNFPAASSTVKHLVFLSKHQMGCDVLWQFK